MSLSKSEEKFFNTKNIAILAGVGIAAAGLLYWAMNDPAVRMNDKLAIKIYKEMIRETYPLWRQVAQYSKIYIPHLRKIGEIKSKEGQKMTKTEIDLLRKVIGSNHPGLTEKIHLARTEVICKKYKIPYEFFIEYTKKINYNDPSSAEFSVLIARADRVMTEAFQGLETLFACSIPPCLTKETIYKINLEARRNEIQTTAQLVKSYLGRGEVIPKNNHFLEELSKVVCFYLILTGTLKQELPQLFRLEHHAFNYFLLAVEGIKGKHKEWFLKGYEKINLKREEIFSKLISTELTVEQVDELIGVFIDYDPLKNE